MESVADTETLEIFGKVGANFGETQRLQLTFNNFFDNETATVRHDEVTVFDIPGQQKSRAIVVPDVQFIGVSGRENRNTVVALDYNHDDLFNSQVQGQLSYRFNRRGSDAFDFRPFDDTLQQQEFNKERLGARLQIETPLASNLGLLWGADYGDETNEQITNLGDEAEFDLTEGRVFRKIDEIGLPYDFNSLGVFAQLQWEPSDRWVVSGGARYERFKVEVDNFLTSVPPFQEDSQRDRWQENLLSLGEVVNRQPQAIQVIQRHGEKIAQAKATLKPMSEEQEVLLLSMSGIGSISAFVDDTFAGKLLEDLGFQLFIPKQLPITWGEGQPKD